MTLLERIPGAEPAPTPTQAMAKHERDLARRAEDVERDLAHLGRHATDPNADVVNLAIIGVLNALAGFALLASAEFRETGDAAMYRRRSAWLAQRSARFGEYAGRAHAGRW